MKVIFSWNLKDKLNNNLSCTKYHVYLCIGNFVLSAGTKIDFFSTKILNFHIQAFIDFIV